MFRRLYAAGAMHPDALTGVVSWKFEHKTGGLSIGQAKQLIAANPGYDLYLFDPPQYQLLPYLAWNCWTQMDMTHGRAVVLRLRDLFASIPDYAGIDITRFRLRSPCSVYANYWVANRATWDRYLAFCEPLTARLDTAPALRPLMFESGAPGRWFFGDHGLYPHVMERMMPTLLACTEHGLRIWRYDGWAFAQRAAEATGIAPIVPIIDRMDRMDRRAAAGLDVERVQSLLDLAQQHYWSLRQRSFRPPPAVPLATVIEQLDRAIPR